MNNAYKNHNNLMNEIYKDNIDHFLNNHLLNDHLFFLNENNNVFQLIKIKKSNDEDDNYKGNYEFVM